MTNDPRQIARDRVMDLANDPAYRPYVVGYLLSCLDERHWEALVQSALEYVEGLKELERDAQSRARGLLRGGS